MQLTMRFFFRLVLLPLVWFSLPAVAHPTNAVAVADFEMTDARSDSKDWAFGLADVLAVELQQRGVTLFERQQIRVVLGEREITASGLMQLRGNPAQDIPDLSYLVTGNIRELTNGQFHVEAALVAARTGRNAASFAREGRYPKDISAALAALADEIATQLKATGNSVLIQPPANAGPGATPEVNLLFYKGVAYCLAGKPELGVTWFIDLQTIAPDFLPARVWTMRAFQMIGLTNFAAIALDRLREAPGGQGVLNCLDQSRFLNWQLVTVAVLADPQMDVAGWKFQAALKTGLGRCPGLFVADPANIRSLAAEMDLQLTENGSRDLELDSVLWSAVDALALVRPAADSGGKSCSVELRDALSGEVLFHGQAPDAASEMDGFCRKLAAHIRGKGKLSEPGNLTGQTQSRAVKPAQVSNTDRNEFAGLLKYLSKNLSDREAWMRLALFVRWLNTSGGGRYDGGYEQVIADRVVAATDLNSSDAAHWLSIALWLRRYYENPPPPIAVEAATLLSRFPESPEAQYVRSALAMELVDQHKYAEAARLFLKLADELPHLSGTVNIRPDFWANFYFFAAATFHQLGDEAHARQFLGQAAEMLRQHPDIGLSYASGEWGNPFPQNHLLFGPDQDLRQAVATWQARISPLPQTNGNTMTLEQLDAMQAEVSHLPDKEKESRARRVEFLKRLIEHKESHLELYQGRINESDYKSPYRKVEIWGRGTTYGYFSLPGKLVMEATGLLAQLARSHRHIEETRHLADLLAEHLNAPIAASCFEAVGESERALQKVEEAIAHPAPFPPLSFGMHPTREQSEAAELRERKIHLLQVLGRWTEAAAYAQAQARTPLHDADAQLSATVDAAKACVAIGHTNDACRLFSEFVQAEEPAGKMDAQSAAARLWWAEYEAERGNQFAASELLREVIKQSEGKDWGVYLRTGYAKAYDAAVSRLAKIRSQAQEIPAASTDWEYPPQTDGNVSADTNALTAEMEHDLADILHGKSTGPNQTSYGYGVDDFIKKYGSNAVPVVLQTAEQGDFPAHLIAQFKLLDRIATPADAPAVLEAFKYTPRLAQTAFRLDATNATAILAERFAIYTKGGEIPPELLDVIGKYRLKNEYPVLIANLSTKELNGNLAPDTAAVDRVLRRGATPAQRASFRAALASLLEKQLLTSYRNGLDSLAETALRNGVPEGIEARLRSDNPVSTNCLVCLRKYLVLPADNDQALMVVQAGLGRWQWDSKTKTFVLGETGTGPSASTPSRNETTNELKDTPLQINP